jgi:DNA polymerase III subunit delta'
MRLGRLREGTACRTSLSCAHPDVTLVHTEPLSIGVDEVRELVRRSAMSPTVP